MNETESARIGERNLGWEKKIKAKIFGLCSFFTFLKLLFLGGGGECLLLLFIKGHEGEQFGGQELNPTVASSRYMKKHISSVG